MQAREDLFLAQDLGFAGGEILTATQRYSFIVTSNQGQFRVFESATGFTVDIDPLPNGGAYSLAPKAGSTPGAQLPGGGGWVGDHQQMQ